MVKEQQPKTQLSAAAFEEILQAQKPFEEAQRALEKLTKAGMDRGKLIGTLIVVPLLPQNVVPMGRSIRTFVKQIKKLADRIRIQNENSGFLYEASLDLHRKEKALAAFNMSVYQCLPVWLHWYANYTEDVWRQRSRDRQSRKGSRKFAIQRLQEDIKLATGRYHDADLAMLLDAVFMAYGKPEQFDEDDLRKLRGPFCRVNDP
jgi:hypothetical protein